MAKFGKGSRAIGVSDRSGFRYPLSRMRREWTGAVVGPDEFEPRHPQLSPKIYTAEATALRGARPQQPIGVDVTLWRSTVARPDLTAPRLLVKAGVVTPVVGV